MRSALIPTLAAAAVALVVVAQTGSAQEATAARTITVIQQKAQPTFVDLGRRSRGPMNPTAGDLMVFDAKLTDESGAAVGRSQGYCVAADVRHRGEECSFTFGFRDGQLTGSGGIVYGRTFTMPVTGGTGAYEGARGSMRLTSGRSRDVVEIRLLP